MNSLNENLRLVFLFFKKKHLISVLSENNL
jgi:hypothetical protein